MSFLHTQLITKVICINVLQTCIALRISVTVRADDNSLHVSSAIAVVGDVCGHLCTVHKPGEHIPVPVTSLATIPVTGTRTPVVCTYKAIFCVVGLAEGNNEVVPIGSTVGVVDKAVDIGLTCRDFYEFGAYLTEATGVVICSNNIVLAGDSILCTCH